MKNVECNFVLFIGEIDRATREGRGTASVYLCLNLFFEKNSGMRRFFQKNQKSKTESSCPSAALAKVRDHALSHVDFLCRIAIDAVLLVFQPYMFYPIGSLSRWRAHTPFAVRA